MKLVCSGNETILYKERTPVGRAVVRGGRLETVEIDPAWRRRGYGSYLVRELLRQGGGFDRRAASCFTAPLPAPDNAAARALARKFGFAEQGGQLVRRRVPDLSAVALCHEFLRAHCPAGGRYLDATCGNGHDTLFLCELSGPQGRVTALDLQPAAVETTNRRLAEAGWSAVGRAIVLDHAHLARIAAPESLDGVVFNFGWLPGADHQVHSTAEGSVPALAAALEALRPGGVLAAVLYSGQVIGDSEKRAALAFFRALPLARYTVLECRFANWADTAPLPVFVMKRFG